MTIITSVEELKAIYEGVSEASLAKVTKTLTPEYRQMIEASPFVAFATVGPEGLDCSPRGDLGGAVRVQDDTTLLLPDWRGNNRIDSLINIVRDPRVALMFLVPGSNTTMRVNGRAVISVEPALLESFEMDGRHPRSVTVITVDEVYFQCARALMRAELWNPEHFVDPKNLPTPGTLLKAAKADFDKEAYDREWPERAARTMW
ncbi:pyridoxamine 5'-phosphate oxidase family protein [Neorhizobium galegae]|uniref:pyridoxamine 5'-phosphate oxidase family protein n=1 Tax=Neorhizobium galegae TaxID=399 RepID=UPI0006211A28|nr:pyridoxamine 5'-phosphate oxidase family protein [Neorhizobium galegae]CDZ30451.1 Pyridoxamine 5'-phosphate oxidase-related FMN-binding protein [Neorhizobium galegae bv. officinalis]KAA9387121.1 pyridoxamine 5'-phosphate oxidase family protein [Neorhizobium galegae]KAB1114267.1 pyridoxamine 5'-phosphate oxidase family protein [Neorhizobium galegae]MCM2497370.1 pyridoxamine 5'-phosphate oxidase family protein [Neorhizobium galegae]MCQ1771460.1 pyridoxamine 5'-phosphate oxidase family protein